VCVIINDTSKKISNENNPNINPHNLERGANHRAEGETKSAVATREKVHITAAKWQTIKAAVNHGAVIPPDSRREVLMGTSTPCISKKRLLQEKSKIKRMRESASAASWLWREKRSNASHANGGRHHRPEPHEDNLEQGRRGNHAQNLDLSFLSVNERRNIVPKTPEAALVVTQAYLLTT
jgi:hypothetical protein